MAQTGFVLWFLVVVEVAISSLTIGDATNISTVRPVTHEPVLKTSTSRCTTTKLTACHTSPLSSFFLRPDTFNSCVEVWPDEDQCVGMILGGSGHACCCDGASKKSITTLNAQDYDQGVWGSLLIILGKIKALNRAEKIRNTSQLLRVCASSGVELTVNCSSKKANEVAFLHAPNTKLILHSDQYFQHIQISMELAGCYNSSVFRGNAYLSKKDLQDYNISESWLEVQLTYTVINRTHMYRLIVPTLQVYQTINTSETCGTFQRYRIKMRNSSVWAEQCNKDFRNLPKPREPLLLISAIASWLTVIMAFCSLHYILNTNWT